MANEIARAVEQSRMGATPNLKSSTPTVQFQASAQRAAVGSNGFAESMMAFVRNGANAYGAFDKAAQDQADEKSNQVIREMKPEQIREAVQTGKLWIQDDERAMSLLKEKSGRTAAFEVDQEIQSKINSGEFDKEDRQYLVDYRQERLNAINQSYAESIGFDPKDEHYQRGFNSNISERNMAIFEAHGKRKSLWFQAQQAVVSRADLSGIIKDPNLIQQPEGADVVAGYLNNKTNFTTDHQVVESLSLLVKDAQQADGGSKLLRNLKDKEIQTLGGTFKVADLIDPDVYQNAIVKAESNEYQRSAERTRTFELSISNALMRDDPADAMNAIKQIRDQNQWVQSSENLTPQKQMLINAEQQVLERVRRDSQATAAATEKATKQATRVAIVKDRINARLNGELATFDPKQQEVTPATGEFKESDLATAASQILEDINNSELSPERKAAETARYLRIDKVGGPFYSRIEGLMSDAQNQWDQGLVNPEANDFSKLEQVQRMYAADPATIGALFPDSAVLLEELKDAANAGLTPELVLRTKRDKKPITVEDARFKDSKWAELTNDGKNPQLSAMPAPIAKTARLIYDSAVGRGVSPENAKGKLTNWLNENTLSFTTPGDETDYRGMLYKKDLIVDPNDVNSWESGKQILNDALEGFSTMPDFAGLPMTVSATEEAITIESINGRRVRIPRETMRLIHEARQRAARDQQMATETKDAQLKQQAGAAFKDFTKGGR